MLISLESTLLYTLHKIQCTSELIRVKLNFIGVVRLRLTPITHITAVLVFTGQCHNQLPLLQKQSNKKESRVEQKTKINVFSDYSLVGWLREMEEDAFVKFGRLWAPVWRTIKTVDVIQQHRHFFHYSYSFINGPTGTNLFPWTL